MAFIVVVVVECQHATAFDWHAFDVEMLNRKWTRFAQRQNSYCAEVRGCRSEAEAVSAVEAEIQQIVEEIGWYDWHAACYLPDMASAG
jgi:L-arabinose isomerase